MLSGQQQGDVNTSPLRQKYWKRNLTAEAQSVHERDERHFLHQSLSTPVLNVIQRAEGAYFEDADGRRYLDLHGNGVHNVGFNHPAVLDAVRKQLDDGLTFCPRRFTNEVAVQLAETLAEITPKELSRTLFCPGGSEAVEMALMLARHITGRYKVIAFRNAYHGGTFGASSIAGQEHFRGGLGPLLPGVFFVDFPNYFRNPWGFEDELDVDRECLRQIEVIMEEEGDVGAVIGEPISATPLIPRPEYWDGVRNLCDDHGALLIFDEIIEGFGRTGAMFACEHYVTPDVMVLGKSLGGGLLPLAGIVTREEHNTLAHRSIGHYTHEKSALCCAAGLAAIGVILEEGLCDHAATLGRYTLERLESLKQGHRLIGNVTGKGLHLGVELVRDQATQEPAVEEAEAVMFKCMEKGVAFKTIDGNGIAWRPALVATQEDMDYAINALDQALTDIESGHGY